MADTVCGARVRSARKRVLVTVLLAVAAILGANGLALLGGRPVVQALPDSAGQRTQPTSAGWLLNGTWFQHLIFLYASGNKPIQQQGIAAANDAGLTATQASQVSQAVRQAWVRLLHDDPATVGRPDTQPNVAAQQRVLDDLRAQFQALAGPHYTAFLDATETRYAQAATTAWLAQHGLTSPQAASTRATAPATTSASTTPGGYTTVWATSFSLSGNETLANGKTITPSDAYVAVPDAYLKFTDLGIGSQQIPSFDQPYYLGNTAGTPPFYTVNLATPDGQHSITQVPIGDVGPWNEDDNWWNATQTSTQLPSGCPIASSTVSSSSLANAQVDGICPGPQLWRRLAYYLLYQHAALPFFQTSAYAPTGSFSDPNAFPTLLPLNCPEAALASINDDGTPCAVGLRGYNNHASAWERDNTDYSPNNVPPNPISNQSGIDLSPAVDAALGWTWPSSGFVQVDVSALPAGINTTLATQHVAKQWYFAEGYTGSSFAEYLTLENPGNSPANITVEYLLQGAAPQTKNYVVPGRSRLTRLVNNEIGANQSVSMIVTSDQPIVAERPMYFTYAGLPGLLIPGGTDVLGATSLGQDFDFGYLDTTAEHQTFLTVLNNNSAPMTVTVNYYVAAGGTPTTLQHSCAATSRCTLNVNGEGLPAGTYSAMVHLDAAGLVERPMYYRNATTGYTGSADVVGVASAQSAWYFAEGYTSPTFREWYYVANPSAAPVNATLTFYRSDGTLATVSAPVAAGAQWVVDANAVLGSAQVNNSAALTASAPILAERVMSFTYTGGVGSGSSAGNASIPGGSDVLGTNAPGTLFDFAEGYTSGQYAEYLTLENPATTTATVTVTYLPSDGSTPVIRTYTVPATSRATISTNQVMSQSFSMQIVANQPIVAERPMYFVYTGSNRTQTGGTDIVGYQP